MTTQIKLHTVFRWCNDVDTMRVFYSDLLGLNETYYRNDNEHGWLTYDAGTQLVFMRGTNPVDVMQGWAKQPGYLGGEAEVDSWLITLSAADFENLKKRIVQAGLETFSGNLDTSRQLILHDPMGMTIEVGIDPDAP